MSNNNEEKSFWSTLPGILTGIAAILTAIGGLIIALNAAGIISISPDATPTPTPPSAILTPSPTSTPNKEAYLRNAEKLTGDWFVAFQNINIDALVKLADTPFFFDQEILLSTSDVREKYQLLLYTAS